MSNWKQVRRDVQKANEPMDDTISMYLLEDDCEVVYAAFRCVKHVDALLAELEQAERREQGERTRVDFLTKSLSQAERLRDDYRSRLLDCGRDLQREQRRAEQAERERDEARSPFFGKHSWDELIYEAEETHRQAVECGGYGTTYLRLAEALRDAQAQLAKVPALVDALREIAERQIADSGVLSAWPNFANRLQSDLRDALAVFEQEQG